jgi:hypothetical protein
MATITLGRTLSPGTDGVTATQGPAGAAAWPVKNLAQLVPEEYDYLALSYNGSGQVSSAVYKQGGAGGATVATLTLVYSGMNLVSVTRA